ncbi:PQQ-binding-like beta-propeller repeat protein [Ktedonospora formicarum]|uniref:Pyrrolo-quinoline quinone repeat domain-containing protein n=1 Tax=Ktedonospora formicarum TaxID=2778364 RepID=A0A8J3I8J0_9CHLR|nr:PQQ-binding-like beta-propeller repeat protein [Ktedonospora formicarum]GHO47374.1 hypothetical protein KSX_55370 [Ktedonospora formicarum]
MKDSGRIGWTQRSKVLSIVTLALIVALLLGTVTFLSFNKKQAQGNAVTTRPVPKTPTAVTSSGIYMVANRGSFSNSLIRKADIHTRKVLWDFSVPHLRASSLTVINNTVYYSTNNDEMSENAVYALDANKGTLRWKTVLAGHTDQAGYLSQPLYANGLVYVITQGTGTVTALDANKGKVRWIYDSKRLDTSRTENGQVAVSNGTIYGIVANRLFMISADTGKTIRNIVQIDQDMTFLDIQIIGNTLYAHSCSIDGLIEGKPDSYIYAFDAAQGTQRWLYHSATLILQSIFLEENIYFIAETEAGQRKTTISSLNAEGRPIWHKDVLNNGRSKLVAGNGLLSLGYDVYDVQKNKNTSYLLTLHSENGAQAWIKKVDAAPELIQNGILYTGLRPCQIGAFNPEKSNELWHQQYCVPTNNRDRSTPDFVVVP